MENPFRSPGVWYKANLHAHTTASDGDLTPEDAADFYCRAGYHILAITDHHQITDITVEHPGFLLLPGIELDGGRSPHGKLYHIVGVGLRARGELAAPPDATGQAVVNMIRERAGLAFIAHPYWTGLLMDDITALPDCFAIEVYNTGCDLEILRGFSSVHWDDLLTAGYAFGGLAVDDGHAHACDHGGAWTMIRAEELSQEAILDALVRGRYYASTGPEIHDVSVIDGVVKVTTSPVTSIALVSTPARGGRRRAVPGTMLTSAELPVPETSYCRIEVMDDRGKIAWSNPFFLSGHE